MPYIRLYIPEVPVDHKREIAKSLTDAVMGVLKMPDEARDWLTIHFATFEPQNLAVGGKLVEDGSAAEFYIDYIDLEINQRIKDELAHEVTAAIGKSFGLPSGQMGRINFRFQALSPDEIAMGGHYVRKLITT